MKLFSIQVKIYQNIKPTNNMSRISNILELLFFRYIRFKYTRKNRERVLRKDKSKQLSLYSRVINYFII